MKTCSKCKNSKPEKCFSKQSSSADGLKAWCKECHSAYRRSHYLRNISAARYQVKKWKNENKDKCREHQSKSKSKRRFKDALSASVYSSAKKGVRACTATVTEIASAFHGVCDVCGVLEEECNTRLNMDHNHATGEFRGWLCGNCNRAAGLLKDSSVIARKLSDYLEE